MKGVILSCLSSLVKEQFGNDKWLMILKDAGMEKKSVFLSHESIDDAKVVDILNSLCKILNVSLQQAADVFGDYWVNTFAPAVYPLHYRGVNSAREFLLKMDEVHEITTRSIPGATPPHFDYEWKNDQTLIMTYHSIRGLIDIFVGLIRGVGKHFNEDLAIRVLDKKRVEIVFP
ncbi:heme NO-binding domain-containing protein [bacterium]|nr:heme NO-binding domain-containing protein [bacterium]